MKLKLDNGYNNDIKVICFGGNLHHTNGKVNVFAPLNREWGTLSSDTTVKFFTDDLNHNGPVGVTSQTDIKFSVWTKLCFA